MLEAPLRLCVRLSFIIHYSDLNLPSLLQMLLVKVVSRSFSTWSVFISFLLIQFSPSHATCGASLVIGVCSASPLPRFPALPSPDFARSPARTVCTLHPFPSFLPHPQALVFSFSALLYPLLFTHPGPMGLSSSPLSLTSQPARALVCPWCLITHCSLPNPAFSGPHPHIHSYFNRSCAVRDQTCKTSSSRVQSSMQGGTQTCSGNLKISSGANENQSSRCVATTPWSPGSALIN